jgi:hypothetical protein
MRGGSTFSTALVSRPSDASVITLSAHGGKQRSWIPTKKLGSLPGRNNSPSSWLAAAACCGDTVLAGAVEVEVEAAGMRSCGRGGFLQHLQVALDYSRQCLQCDLHAPALQFPPNLRSTHKETHARRRCQVE